MAVQFLTGMLLLFDIHFAIWRDLFFYNRTDPVLFQSLDEKNKNKNSSHRTRAIRWASAAMAISSALGAVRARSARGRVFIEPWVTPTTAGAMKIERGVVYNPTIHHGYLSEKIRHAGRRQGQERRPLPPVPCKLSGGLCSKLFILINILFILFNPSCPRVLVSQHKQQPTIIWLGITRLVFRSGKLNLIVACSRSEVSSSSLAPATSSLSDPTGLLPGPSFCFCADKQLLVFIDGESKMPRSIRLGDKKQSSSAATSPAPFRFWPELPLVFIDGGVWTTSRWICLTPGDGTRS